METGLVLNLILLWIVVLFNLLLTLALVRRLNNTSTRSVPTLGLPTGQKAPDFRAQSLDGEIVTRSQYAGRNVALVFISTHCAPCQNLIPKLLLLAQQAIQASVEIVLVSSDDREETRIWAEQEQIPFPILVAPRATNSFFADYQITLTPAYCFVNVQSTIQSAGHPVVERGSWKAFDEWIRQESLVA